MNYENSRIGVVDEVRKDTYNNNYAKTVEDTDSRIKYDNYSGFYASNDTTKTKKTYVSPDVEFLPQEDFNSILFGRNTSDSLTSAENKVDYNGGEKYNGVLYEPIDDPYKPSDQTMRHGTDNVDDYATVKIVDKKHTAKMIRQEKKNSEYGLNLRGKILIGVYALVVTTIFALILINARMLRNIDSSIDTYNAQIETLNEEVIELSAKLQNLSSNETISEKAIKMGMVKGE